MTTVKFSKEDYDKSLEELSRLLTDNMLKPSLIVPTIPSIYAKFPIKKTLRKYCKHEQSTIVIESDENGNKSQITICIICGKLLPKSEINQDSVI